MEVQDFHLHAFLLLSTIYISITLTNSQLQEISLREGISRNSGKQNAKEKCLELLSTTLLPHKTEWQKNSLYQFYSFLVDCNDVMCRDDVWRIGSHVIRY